MISFLIHLLFITQRQFYDSTVRCLEVNATCEDNDSVFKDDEVSPPGGYYEEPDADAPPAPYCEDEISST